MSISSEISRIKGNVADAYTALSAKGATMPSLRNTANLKSTIESIEMMTAEAMSIETIRAICYVPSDFERNYTQLEYIQSSGTQYIDTEFKPSGTTRVVCDVQIPVALSASAGVFGARRANAAQFWCYKNAAERWYFRYGTDTSGVYVAGTATERAVIDANCNSFTVGGTTVTSTSASFTSSYNLWLFAINSAGAVQYGSSVRFYSCRIYDNGTLVRDFVPCRRSSDGVVGLYDKVNEQFYGNAGSGSFTGA